MTELPTASSSPISKKNSWTTSKKSRYGRERIDRDEFTEMYLLSVIQRDLKVVGRFHYLDVVKGKTAYKDSFRRQCVD